MDIEEKFNDKTAGIAVEKGIAHLWSLNENGRWKGFPTLAGESDTWVTGFILAHIFHLSKNVEKLKKTEDLLLHSRHSSGGWSYGNKVPPDADSTAWCLVALQKSNRIPTNLLEEAKAFLWSHFYDKGISTFRDDTGIREYIEADEKQSIDGWTSIHADVSAAAVLADPKNPKVPLLLTWLLSQQNSSGFINAYWWRGPHYTTALFLRALSKCKYRLSEEAGSRILRGLQREQLKDGGYGLGSSTIADPFTTALALESFAHLRYLGYDSERAACGKTLLRLQQKKGGWNGDLIMRIPAPGVLDPSHDIIWKKTGGGGNTYIEDKEGVFATALACHAIDTWRRSETSSKKDKLPILEPALPPHNEKGAEVNINVK